MPWLAVAIAVVPSTEATALALATSHTLTRVRIFGLVCRASSAVARSGVDVIPRSCRGRAVVAPSGHVPEDPLAQPAGTVAQLLDPRPQPGDALARVAEPDEVGRPGVDDGVERPGEPGRRRYGGGLDLACRRVDG